MATGDTPEERMCPHSSLLSPLLSPMWAGLRHKVRNGGEGDIGALRPGPSIAVKVATLSKCLFTLNESIALQRKNSRFDHYQTNQPAGLPLRICVREMDLFSFCKGKMVINDLEGCLWMQSKECFICYRKAICFI